MCVGGDGGGERRGATLTRVRSGDGEREVDDEDVCCCVVVYVCGGDDGG